MTSDKIKQILCELGYSLKDFGNHWRTNALYRGGKNPTALQIYKDSGVWVDFVKNSPHLPLESLIQATLQTNDPEEVKKITGGYDFSIDRTLDIDKPKLEMEKTYPDTILSRLLPHYKFYNDKGISDKTIMFFKAGLATEGSMYQRFVFPIYNSSGQIHGFSGRNISKLSTDKPKWKHMGKKSTWIYPYYLNGPGNEVQQAIESEGFVVLVESIGDLLNLHENGIKNVLVTFGTSISSSLVCFLISLGCQRIILSLNNDFDKEKNRGLIGSYKSYLKLLNYFPKECIIIHPPSQNDFGDMAEQSFSFWLEYIYDKKYTEDQLNYHQNIKLLIKNGDIPKTLYKKKYFS